MVTKTQSKILKVSLALLLTACAQETAFSPVNLPAQWTIANSDNTLVNHWLAVFADKQLNQLVEQALNNNFDLTATAARLSAAQAQVQLANAPRLPQLSFSPSYQKYSTNYQGTSVSDFPFSALFSVNWEIDVWGRIRASQQSAQHLAEAMQADWQFARLSLSARTAQTYFELSEAHAQVAVVQQSVQDRRTIAELVQGRFARGLTKGLDVRMVQTDLANAEAQLASANNRVQMLARQLQVLLGRYPSAHIRYTTPLPNLDQPIQAGLPAEVLARRPDIVASFQRLQASEQQLLSAKKALLPRISLTASGGTSSPALAELIDPKSAAWNVLAGLTQPLFMGHQLSATIELNQALLKENMAHYQQTVLTAMQEVEQALNAEQQLRLQERALHTAVQETQASRELAVSAYRQGLIQILTLLDSYRSTLYAQSQHLSVQRQLLNNRIALYLALGGAL